MLSAYIVIMGLLLGSFLNVVIYRFPRGESVVLPASHCPHCNHQIKPWENIPVLSFLFLRGRCSACRAAISPRYPLVEILTGIIFYASFYKFGLSWDFLVFSLFGALLITIAFIDIDHMIIPDSMVVIGFIPGFYLWFRSGGDQLILQLVGLFGLGLAFWLIRLVGTRVFKREAMGLGDVKFAAMAGWVQGWGIGIVSMFLAFLAATLLFTVLIPMGVIKRKQQVPFGPFLCLGIWLGTMWGREIIDWYLTLFMAL